MYVDRKKMDQARARKITGVRPKSYQETKQNAALATQLREAGLPIPKPDTLSFFAQNGFRVEDGKLTRR